MSVNAREEARMRAENTEGMRQKVWAQLAAKLCRGELTENEVKYFKLQFWEDRRADQRAAAGKFDLDNTMESA